MKKSISVNKIIFLFIVFIMWALLAFNTNTVDRSNYEMFYSYSQQRIRYPGIEIGFYFFMRICSKIGLSFQGFLIAYSSVGTILITKSVTKYIDKGRNTILILFIFFPYLHIIAALRNYMTFSILIWAIQYLTIKTPKNIIKYIICIIVASCFHVISLLYLLFIFCYQNENRIKKISICFSIFGFFILATSSKVISLLINTFPKLQIYLSQGFGGTRNTTKIFLFMYFITKIIFCLYCKIDDDQQTNNRPLSVMRKVQLLSLIFFPICVFDMDFMRLEYNILILMSMYMYGYIREKYNEQAEKKKFRFLTLSYGIYYIISGYILLYLFSSESIVKTIWGNNLLL